MEKLLEYLDEEIAKHREKENAQSTVWERGFENGSMTEAILLRNKVRAILKNA